MIKLPENRLILILFFPIFMEQALTVSMGTIHSVMVSGIGKEAISAVGLVNQISDFFTAFFTSMATGATVLIAQHMGSRENHKAKQCAGQALLIGTAISLFAGAALWFYSAQIFGAIYQQLEQAVLDHAIVYLKISALTFPTFAVYSVCAGIMRGGGEMKKPMKIALVSGIINVVVSAMCIYGFHLGTLGAGIGLAVSRAYSCFAALYMLKKDAWIERATDILLPKWYFLKNIVKIGTFIGTESVLFSVGKILTNSFVVAAGTDHIAANTIGGAIFNLIIIPGNAMAVVATTLVGRHVGAQNENEAKTGVKNISKLTFFLLLFACIVTIPFYPPLFRLYTADPGILPLLYRIMLINAALLPLSWTAAGILAAGLRGAGDALYPSINTVVNMWACRILLAFLLTKYLHMGVVGVWLAQYVDWHVRGAFNYLRFRSGKWIGKKLI